MRFMRGSVRVVAVLSLAVIGAAQSAFALTSTPGPTPPSVPYNQYIANFQAFNQPVGGGAAESKVGLSMGKATQAAPLTVDVTDNAGGSAVPMMRISVDAAGNCTVNPPFNKVFTPARCWRELQQNAHHIATKSSVVVPNMSGLLGAIDTGADINDPPVVTD